MGCCETRDEIIETKIEPKVKIRTMSRYIDFNALQDQDLIVVSSSQLKDLNLDHDSMAVRYYIEWCRQKHKWKELSIFIWDNSPINEETVVNSYSLPPQTISSLVLVYFEQGVKDSVPDAIKISENMIPDLLKLVCLSDCDFIINFVLLVNSLLVSTNEKVIKYLMNFSFFETIRKYLSSKEHPLRKNLLKICSKLCKDRKNVQDKFIQSECLLKIIRLLVSSKLDIENDLEDLLLMLVSVVNLPGDASGTINEYALKKFHDYSLPEILNTLKTLVSEPFSPSMSYLISLLSMNN
jgi:hypothetical protein